MRLLNHYLSAERAAGLLQAGQPLRDCYVSGKLELATGDSWDQEVVLENCVVENFHCLSVSFRKLVQLRDCQFKQCDFSFSFFLGGLSIEACSFDSYLDFQAGGHNQAGAMVCIVNNRFTGFVNFFDCWYESAVIITDNHFLDGTNLLGQPHDIPVTFDVAPLLARNYGQLDAQDENLSALPNG